MKTCKHCGQICDDDALFCLNCGQALKEEEAPEEMPEREEPKAAAENQEEAPEEMPKQEELKEAAENQEEAPEEMPKQEEPKAAAETQEIDLTRVKTYANKAAGTAKSCVTNKKIIIGILGGVAAVAVLAGAASLMGIGKTKINLNDYVTFQDQGYDTAGTSSIYFDAYAMLDDNRKAFGIDLNRQIYFDGYTTTLGEIIPGYFRIDFEEYPDDLSNGDKVVAKWDVSEEALEELEDDYDIIFKYKDIKHKVEDLEEVEKKDIFKDVVIHCSGYNGAGTVEAAGEDEYYNLEFTIKPEDEKENGTLSNGDKVEVQLDVFGKDLEGYMIRNYGVIPEKYEKEYTVEGLDEMEEFNPFDQLSVDVSGKSPYLSLEIEDHNTMYGIDFRASKTENIAIGDVITITASSIDGQDLEELCRQNGLVLKKDSEEYEIGNADAYVQSLDEIPDDIWQKMESKARQVLIMEAANDSWEPWDLQNENIHFLGNYFFKRIERNDDRDNVYTKFVYQITGDTNGRPSPLYGVVEFGDVVILKDGTATVNLEEYWLPDNDVYGFPGYTDLDSLFYNEVAALTDRFTYESTVEGQ